MSEINEDGAELVSLDAFLTKEIGTEPNQLEEQFIRKDLGDNLPIETLMGLDPLETNQTPLTVDKIPDAVTATENVVNEEDVSKQATKKTSEDYLKLIRITFGDSFDTIIQEENGVDVEYKLEDLDLDEETVAEIIRNKMDQIKESASKDKISTAGISDITKSLIEIDKNGGDISQVLRQKEAYLDPLDQLDISTLEGQREAVWLRKKADGTPDRDIQLLIKSYESEGILEEMAITADTELRKGMQDYIASVKKAAEDEAQKYKEYMKTYKKQLRDSLSQFELNEAVKDKIVNAATKEKQTGGYEIDNLYTAYRKDPEKSARLSLFMLDEDEYINQVSKKKVVEKQVSTANKLRLKSRNTDVEQIDQDRHKDKNLIPLDGF